MGDPLGLKAPLEVFWGVVCELRGPDGPLAAVEVRGRSRDTATPEMILIERSCSASRRDCVEIRRSPCRVKRAERRSPVTARAASSTAHGRKADMGLPSRRRQRRRISDDMVGDPGEERKRPKRKCEEN